MNTQTIPIDTPISYVCPWTGFTQYGTIDTECDGGTYDIRNVDGGVEVSIHHSDIIEILEE